MKILRIGIITHYYKSVNYGGNLQAYALCKVLTKLGYNAEQIQYENISGTVNYAKHLKKFKFRNIFKYIIKVYNKFYRIFNYNIYKKEISKTKNLRNKAFFVFNRELIPHSDKVYNVNDISDSLTIYNTFITGSDQVWNPLAYNIGYLLGFVPNYIPKMSYSASISVDSLTKTQELVFKKNLKDYIGVSVREYSAVKLLEKLSPIIPVVSLDPTLLLSQDEWNEVASERLIEQPYVFCYFLGKSKNQRKLAYDFAHKKGLCVVGIPHLNGDYNKDDIKYYDKALYEISPEKFISLIKYSSCVFTDSFHATAFSLIYNKKYYVFNRSGKKNMNTRLYNISNIFGTQDRFCDSFEKESLDYLLDNYESNYNIDITKYNEMKKISLNYLKDTLNKAEKMINNEN